MSSGAPQPSRQHSLHIRTKLTKHSFRSTMRPTIALAGVLVLLLGSASAGSSLRGLTRPRVLEDTTTAPATASSSTPQAAGNATTPSSTNSTSSPPPPESIKNKLEDDLKKAEESINSHKLSHSEIAVAGTFGGLLLASMFGCAGFLLYRRFQSARGGNRKAQRSEYYSAEREFGDAAEL